MENSTPRDAEFELWWLIHQTTHLMTRARDRELRRYGLLIVQAGILFAVQVLGNRAMPVELARWLAREPHTISGVLDNMVKKGLVRKVKDLDRKNLVRVAITDKGRQVYSEIADRSSIHDMMLSLSEEDRDRLRGYMERLRAKALTHLGTGQELPAPPFP